MPTTNAVEKIAEERNPSIQVVEPIQEKEGGDRLFNAAASPSPTGDLILHVRFNPDSSVWRIDECPAAISKEGWFKLLCARVGNKYQTRAGRRGFFRISRIELEALKTLRPH